MTAAQDQVSRHSSTEEEGLPAATPGCRAVEGNWKMEKSVFVRGMTPDRSAML